MGSMILKRSETEGNTEIHLYIATVHAGILLLFLFINFSLEPTHSAIHESGGASNTPGHTQGGREIPPAHLNLMQPRHKGSGMHRRTGGSFTAGHLCEQQRQSPVLSGVRTLPVSLPLKRRGITLPGPGRSWVHDAPESYRQRSGRRRGGNCRPGAQGAPPKGGLCK